MIDAPTTPWTRAQVRVGAACGLLAGVAVAAAAVGAGRQDSLGDQVIWLNLAVLGLVLALVANGALFLAGRRAVGRRRLQLVPDVAATRLAAHAPATGTWLWLRGTARAHVDGCPMIVGKPAEAVDVDGVREHRLVRCEVCG